MKKSTIRTEKRPKKFRFFGRTQYCLTNTRLSGVLFFVQNKKNDCKTLSFVYIIKTDKDRVWNTTVFSTNGGGTPHERKKHSLVYPLEKR